jgi:hypothetical protein
MHASKLGLAALLTFAIAGCDAIGAIFKVGMWAGILIVLLVMGVIFMIARR